VEDRPAPRRLLHVINRLAEHGGAEVSLGREIPMLEARGFRNTVVSLYSYEGDLVVRTLRDQGIEVLDPLRERFSWGIVGDLRQVIRDTEPDLVHTTLFDADLFGRIAALAEGVPVISSLVSSQYGDAAMLEAPAPRKLRVVQGVDIALGRLTTYGFRAITEAVADEAVAHLRLDRERITVVPRGRDRASARSADGGAALRSELGLGPTSEVLLNVARHEAQKGQVHLVRAFAEVARNRPTVHLLVAGRQGSSTAVLEAEIARHGLQQRVHLLGARRDVPELMELADVFVFTSLWEGLGGSVLEAMAASKPVVAFDIPPVREVLGGTGALVAVGSERDLASAVVRLLDDPGEAGRMGEAARARFEEEYESSTVGDRLATFYAAQVAAARRRERLPRALRLTSALRARQGGGSRVGLLATLSAKLIAPLVTVERFLVVARTVADHPEVDVPSGLAIEDVEANTSAIRNGVLAPIPPKRYEGLPRGSSRWFVAVDGDRPIARVCVEYGHERGPHRGWSPRLGPSEVVLSALWVEPRYRGTGIARALLARAARESDRSRALALVNEGNLPSRGLLSGLGYEEVRRVTVLLVLKRWRWSAERA
jgi:glycosyltransferase involved in cell wall biosynthesis/ribosomal protein S18 acetylase RimI-like enzyme